MTKPIDPEIKALRAIVRALETLDEDAQKRAVTWLFARLHGTTQDRAERAIRLWDGVIEQSDEPEGRT